MIRVCRECGVFLDSSPQRKKRKNCPMCGEKLVEYEKKRMERINGKSKTS